MKITACDEVTDMLNSVKGTRKSCQSQTDFVTILRGHLQYVGSRNRGKNSLTSQTFNHSVSYRTFALFRILSDLGCPCPWTWPEPEISVL